MIDFVITTYYQKTHLAQLNPQYPHMYVQNYNFVSDDPRNICK